MKLTDQEKARIYQDVLTRVNAIRAYRGLEPLTELPKGKVGEAQSCPMQKALRCYAVDEIAIEWENDNLHETITPDEIGAFIIAFDDHAFPELEE